MLLDLFLPFALTFLPTPGRWFLWFIFLLPWGSRIFMHRTILVWSGQVVVIHNWFHFCVRHVRNHAKWALALKGGSSLGRRSIWRDNNSLLFYRNFENLHRLRCHSLKIGGILLNILKLVDSLGSYFFLYLFWRTSWCINNFVRFILLLQNQKRGGASLVG